MSRPVFISYARGTHRAEAHALRRALVARGIDAFLDTRHVGLGEEFPSVLQDALLDARLVVALVDRSYYRRPYCAREWHLATLAWRVAAERGPEEGDAEEPLRSLMVALGDDCDAESLQRLPPPLRQRNLPSATSTADIAELVVNRLGRSMPSIRERLDAMGVPPAAVEVIAGDLPIPPPGNLRRVRHLRLEGIGRSLHEHFLGRAHELWLLHRILDPEGVDPAAAGAVSAALEGGAGQGKTQLATEYALRFGPMAFQGGVFWINAASGSHDEDLGLDSQWHDVLATLVPETPSLSTMQEEGRDIGEQLSEAFRCVDPEQRILVIVDDLPEDQEGRPAALHRLVPGFHYVSTLATSRRRLTEVPPACRVIVGILDDAAAVRLLRNGVTHDPLESDEWHCIAAWAGHLPLALDLLNRALQAGAIGAHELLAAARGQDPVAVTDRIHAALEAEVPEGSLRGVSQAMELSYAALSTTAARTARALAWLSPARLLPGLLVPLVESADTTRVRGELRGRSVLGDAGVSGGQAAFRMHALLAAFLRTRGDMPGDDVLQAIKALEVTFREEAASDPTRRDELLDSVDSASTLARHLHAHPDLLDGLAVRLASLGGVLADLGWDAGRVAPLQAAAALHRLSARAPTSPPGSRFWCAAQQGLGRSIAMLGERESGTDHLQEAAAVYEVLISKMPREEDLDRWGVTHHQFGSVMMTWGTRTGSLTRLEEAAHAFREAHQAWEEGGAPLAKRVLALTGLGGVLFECARHEAGTERLEETCRVLRDAVGRNEATEVPAAWRRLAWSNLGVALSELSARTGKESLLEEAAEAHRQALGAVDRAQSPHSWATSQRSLADALHGLGEARADEDLLSEAERAHRLSLDVMTREHAPLEWARGQSSLAITLHSRGELAPEAGFLEAARDAARAALEVQDRERTRIPWCHTMLSLGLALAALAMRDGDALRVSEAIDHYRAAQDALPKGLAARLRSELLAATDRAEAWIAASTSDTPDAEAP